MFLCIAWRWSVALGAVAVMMSLPPAALSDDKTVATMPLAMQQIAPGIYVHQGVHHEADPDNLGGIANIGFVVGTASVAVIDTGGSHAEGVELLAAIRRITSLPVRYVINTHFHPDHILGNDAFISPDGSEPPEFIAHANFTRDLVARQETYLAAARQSLGAAFAGTHVVVPRHLVGQPESAMAGSAEGRTALSFRDRHRHPPGAEAEQESAAGCRGGGHAAPADGTIQMAIVRRL
jgi:hypothetical protein